MTEEQRLQNEISKVLIKIGREGWSQDKADKIDMLHSELYALHAYGIRDWKFKANKSMLSIKSNVEAIKEIKEKKKENTQ